jgi:hypothetical protein
MPGRRYDKALLESRGSDETTNEVRRARTRKKALKVAELDALLPIEYKRKQQNLAGRRLVGLGGRTLEDVLEDTKRFLSEMTTRWHSEPADELNDQVERESIAAQPMLRSVCGAVTVEVETPDWTITAMSPGAVNFFKDAPWGPMMGQSLADHVKWEDLDDLHSLMSGAPAMTAVYDTDPGLDPGSSPPSSPDTSSVSEGSTHASLRSFVRSDSSYSSSRSGSAAQHHLIRLMHFTAVDPVTPSLLTSLPPESVDAHIRNDATVQGWHAVRQSRNDSEDPCSRSDVHDDQDQRALLPQAADGWSDAFAHDPMLCDPQEANNGGSPGCLHGKYVETSIQVLHVAAASPTETPRALVAISLL